MWGNPIAAHMVLSDEQLKQAIIARKIMDETSVQEIIEYAHGTNQTLYDALLEKNITTDENLGLLTADLLKLPFVILARTAVPEEVFRIIPERIAHQYKMIAFAQEANGIKVAMANPNLPEIQTILTMITRKTNLKIIPYYSTEKDISKSFKIYRKVLQNVFDEIVRGAGYAPGVKAGLDRIPAEKIVDMLIRYAYQDGTSDIHIEPQEDTSLVRFRIDGILQDVLTLPKSLHDQVVARIKVISRLRTDEHLSPQDGKMRMKMEEENLDIRVSILPIVDGEKVVMRLLSSKSRQLNLKDLGMSDKDLEKVNRGYAKSYGMILSTGPTGSGKTTSIYSVLKILNTREKNITTTEDPVEYRIKGVNQIQVNPKADLTFASSLRSILRQDPNVIFVGEIRDKETANIAVNAALTGHLVLSTLHTNDAATALPRLMDMDVEPFLVASTVNVIIGQRLLRQICEMCKSSYTVSLEDLSKNVPVESIKKHFEKKDITLYQGKGCKVCHNTGYSGRIGIYEVLEVTPAMRRLIIQKADSDLIVKQALAEGTTLMLDDGLDKCAKGMTTIEEVLRVTKVESL